MLNIKLKYMSKNIFPIDALEKRKEELRLQTPEGLKEKYPLYPVVRKVYIGKEFTFSTLVRKWYNGKYYLIPMIVTDTNEAKAIHNLHSSAHKYLMIGVWTRNDVIDNDQINDATRLRQTNL